LVAEGVMTDGRMAIGQKHILSPAEEFLGEIPSEKDKGKRANNGVKIL